MRAGQPLRAIDLAKPDLVQRDQAVTLIYQTAGIYLTTRGKALDSGTEGDVVSVLNPQSKRTVTGVVTGRSQVTIQVASPQPVYIADTGAAPTPDQSAAPLPPVTDVSSQAAKQE
jgi:flagella basal body P-ring formation protein FlgA